MHTRNQDYKQWTIKITLPIKVQIIEFSRSILFGLHPHDQKAPNIPVGSGCLTAILRGLPCLPVRKYCFLSRKNNDIPDFH